MCTPIHILPAHYLLRTNVYELREMCCRPLYMTPVDAIEYGLIDKIVKSEKEGAITGKVLSGSQYDKQAGLVARQ